jgi:hypothetical protein
MNPNDVLGALYLVLGVYFWIGAILGFSLLITIAGYRRHPERFKGDVGDAADQIEQMIEMRGWTVSTFAVIITVLWLPLLARKMHL